MCIEYFCLLTPDGVDEDAMASMQPSNISKPKTSPLQYTNFLMASSIPCIGPVVLVYLIATPYWWICCCFLQFLVRLPSLVEFSSIIVVFALTFCCYIQYDSTYYISHNCTYYLIGYVTMLW